MVRVKSLLLAGALTIGPAVFGQQVKPLPCQTVAKCREELAAANKSAADLLQMNTDLTKKISDRENMLRILHKETTDTELTEDEKQAVNAMDSTVIHLGAVIEKDFTAERKLHKDAVLMMKLLHKEMTGTALPDDDKQALSTISDSTISQLGADLEKDFNAKSKLRNDAILALELIHKEFTNVSYTDEEEKAVNAMDPKIIKLGYTLSEDYVNEYNDYNALVARYNRLAAIARTPSAPQPSGMDPLTKLMLFKALMPQPQPYILPMPQVPQNNNINCMSNRIGDTTYTNCH